MDSATDPLEYINTIAAACSTHGGRPIPNGYRFLVKFFRCALIDRTQTLQPGFTYRVLDPIPAPRPGLEDIGRLCDARGTELLAAAERRGCELRLLWSGGIDSTAALVALLKAGARDLVQVYLSAGSIRENRRFFNEVIKPQLHYHKIKTIDQALHPDSLIVTGEHGDQIFGSVLAGDYLKEKRWYRNADARLLQPWQKTFPAALRQRLSRAEAIRAERFLRPQLAKSPLPLVTLFDLLWWVNFSMKWQAVTLRLASYQPQHYARLSMNLRHFFRHDDFQRWSLTNHSEKIGTTWASYKMPLKRYINDFFPDPDYLANKLKVASLTGLTRPAKDRVFAVGYEIHVESGSGDSCADDGGE